MDYKNTEVHLTVNIGGSQALLGKFEATQKVDDNGHKCFELWKNPYDETREKLPVFQLKTVQLPRFHNCEQHTTLNGAFCAWAVSDDARPKKTVSVPWWNKLSPKNKLKMAVQQYVWDLYGRDAEFSFQILGE